LRYFRFLRDDGRILLIAASKADRARPQAFALLAFYLF
jgi:hypothetical protein